MLFFARLAYIAPLIAVVSLLSTIYGALIRFTSTPYSDMWKGYLTFYLQVLDGDLTVWLSQFNEHRILFSRILFWLDIKYFGGKSIFLIVMNFVFMAGLWLTLTIYARKILTRIWHYPLNIALSSLLFVVTFSIIQHENIVWAFQSQFFCAFLFTLLAFYFFASFVELQESHYKKPTYFILAIIFGVLASWNVACGILAMPLLVLLSIFLKTPRKYSVIFLLITVITTVIYFYGYQTPSHHNSPSVSILNHKLELLFFTLTYLGSPVFHILSSFNILLGIHPIIPYNPLTLFAGCLFLYWYIKLLFNFYHQDVKSTYQTMLLVYILFIIFTAFITGTARINYSVIYAVISRYSTPALLGWSSLIILLCTQINNKRMTTVASIILTFIAIIFLIPQISSYVNRHDLIATKTRNDATAIALNLNIKDDTRTKMVYPRPDIVYQLSSRAKKHAISIFNKNTPTNTYMNQSIAQFHLKSCNASFNDIVHFNNGYRVSGKVILENRETVNGKIFFVDHEDKIKGIAILAKNPVTLKSPSHISPKRLDFEGYSILDPKSLVIKC